MAELFQTTQQNISLHLQNVYEEGELQLPATHKESLSVRREVRRRLDVYNLDAIISVGYRVKSGVATHFRIWATQRLREYIIKGFTLDDRASWTRRSLKIISRWKKSMPSILSFPCISTLPNCKPAAAS
jgi:hypothetical protein